MHSISSTCSLTRFPPELRRNVFLYVFAERSWAKSLLVALRSTHRNTSLYSEAVQAYYDVQNCDLSSSNAESVSDLSPWVEKLLRTLVLEFSVHQTKSTRLARTFRYRTDHRGRMLTHEDSSVPICHSRILPRPTFETIAPFTNIKVLCLNAAVVSYSRFHQIEGIVQRAVQKFDYLERVEVRSDGAEVVWRDAWKEDCVSLHCNHAWVERLNRGMRVTAMLMSVDSEGCSWPWFWQAPDRETLVWKG